MRQAPSLSDEEHFLVRSLSMNYTARSSQRHHSHSWSQFIYAQKGAVRVELEDQSWIVPPRRGLWIPAHTPHALYMSSALELRTLYFRPEHSLDTSADKSINVSGLLHEAVLRVCEKNWLDSRVDIDVSLFKIILNELAHSGTQDFCLSMPTDPRALRLAHWMLGDMGVKENLNNALADAGLTRRTAERLFQKETGIAPSQWLRLARLSKSMIALIGGGKVDDVSQLAGYKSRSAFTEAFKNVFGITPSEAGR